MKLVAFLVSAAFFAVAAFLALEHDPQITVVVDMDLDLPRPSLGQVFWDDGAGRMRQEASRLFEVRPGRGTYRIALPADLRALRIDPAMEPAAIAIHRIALERAGVPLRTWDGRHGFQGWHPTHDLADVTVRDGVLRLRSVGPDPYLEAQGLSTLQRGRQLLHLAASAALGLLCGGLHTMAMGLALRGAAGAAAPSRPVRPRGALPLLLASTLAGVVLGYVAYRIRGPARPPPPPIRNEHYELTIVDRRGRPLSDKRGDVKLVLDPFTVFRNLPDQKTSRFTIDERGCRAGPARRPDRPKTVILGGSAAFGLGLDSDGDTFAARLSALDPGHEFVNAAVIAFLSGQELAEMVHYADRLAPRLYVVLDGWNDVFVHSFPDVRSRDYGYNWHLFGMLEERLLRLAASEAPPDAPVPAPLPMPPFDAVANQQRVFEAYAANLERMAGFARGRGAALLVVFQPQLGSKRTLGAREARALEEWRAAYPATHAHFVEDYQALVARSRALCDARGIPYLDLEGSPRLRDDPRTLYLDTVHPNAEGHRLIAELVAERLKGLGDGR